MDRALRPSMKAGIIAFCDTEPQLRVERPSPDDWDNLTDVYRFLQPSYEITMATQGIFVANDNVRPAMDYLLAHLETERRKYDEDSFMTDRIDAAWAKFGQYYKLTDDAIAYFAATTLNPLHKLYYFDKNWAHVPGLAESLQQSKLQMRKLWEDTYRPQTQQATTRPVSNQGTQITNEFTNWLQQQIDTEHVDELSVYLNESCLQSGNPGGFKSLEWWLETSQQTRFPHLSRMAMDVLSIPAMTASTERLFSECKATCERSRTVPDTLKEIHLLRSWQRSTILQDSHVSPAHV